jgi:hypothetical protein
MVIVVPAVPKREQSDDQVVSAVVSGSVTAAAETVANRIG